MADSNREEITKLEALYASNPGGRVFVHLAEACRKAGEYERARAILDEGLGRHDDSASGYVVLGRVLSDIGDHDEAETAFRRVLELDPGNLIAIRWIEDRNDARVADRDLNPGEDGDPAQPPESEWGDIGTRADEVVEEAGAGSWLAPTQTPGDIADHDHDAPHFDDPAGSADVEWDDAAVEESAKADNVVGDSETSLEDVITPASTAPGFTDETDDAVVEFSVTEGDVLPGDLADFANLDAESPDPSGSAEAEEDDPAPSEIADMDWSDMGADADETFIADLDRGSDLDVDSLDPGDGEHSYDAAPLPVRALDASLSAELDDSAVLDDAEPEVAEREDAGFGDPAPEDDSWDAAAEDSTDGWAGTTSFEPPVSEAPEWAGELTVAQSDSVDEPADIADGSADTGDESVDTADAPADFGDLSVETVASAESLAGVEPVSGLQAGGYDGALGGPVADRESGTDGLYTETIAELYSSQGFHDRAADVYRSLLKRRPGDDRLTALLADAESRAGKNQPGTGPDLEEDEYGEVWLSASGAEWAPEAQRAEPSPYGWTDQSDDADDADDTESSPAIRSYLQSLVSWAPSAGEGGDAEDVVTPVDEAAGSDPRSEAAQPVEPWTPSDAGSDAERLDEAEPTQPDATPDPWARDPTSAVTASPTNEAVHQTPAAARSKDPVEAAFLEWFGSDDEPAPAEAQDTAAQGSASGQTTAPETTPAADSSPAEPPAAEAVKSRAEFESGAVRPLTIPLDESSVEDETESGEDEDEDLEMFRSWLQSLKK